jgi:hypothetical protein
MFYDDRIKMYNSLCTSIRLQRVRYLLIRIVMLTMMVQLELVFIYRTKITQHSVEV